MKKIADITFKNQQFHIDGDLDFYNVMSVYDKSLSFIHQTSELVFDFSNLNSSDSAGLALIIEWVKLSKELKMPVRFVYLSSDIMSIAKAAGLEGMFNSSQT